MNIESKHQRVLDALQGGARSWDDLKGVAKLNDERLGFTLGELLGQRLIWTAQREDRRMYGIERRTGLVPRFSNQQRQVTDLQQKGIQV